MAVLHLRLAEWVGLACSGVTEPLLVVLEGVKALRRAVLGTFDHPVLVRCHLRKTRNLQDRLPQRLRPAVERRMRSAYRPGSALPAQGQLTVLAREPDKIHSSAASSVREGLSQTLTVLSVDVPPTLVRTLRWTNVIESMISICRDRSKNVKHWRDGQMALRWCAAGMTEAKGQFRRVNGQLHLPALRTALARHVDEQTVGADRHDETVSAA